MVYIYTKLKIMNLKSSEEVVKLLSATKKQINTLLNDSPILLITINSQLDTLINRVSLLSGIRNAESDLTPDELETKFPPIPGDNDNALIPVTKEDLKPELSVKEQFLADVKNFSENIFNQENEKILEAYITSDDIRVIRGAAKVAGIEDFKTAEVNGLLLDKIRENLTAQKTAAVSKVTKDEDIAKQSGS